MAVDNKFWRNIYVLISMFVVSLYFTLLTMRTSVIEKVFKEDIENIEEFYKKWKKVSLLLLIYVSFVVLYHIVICLGLYILVLLYLVVVKDDRAATEHTKMLLYDILVDKMSAYWIVWSFVLFFFFVFCVLYFRFNKSFINGITFQDFIKTGDDDEEKEEHTTPKKLLFYYSWYIMMLMLFMFLLMSMNILFGFKNNILIFNIVCILLFLTFVSMIFLYMMRKRSIHLIFLGLPLFITLIAWKLVMKF